MSENNSLIEAAASLRAAAADLIGKAEALESEAAALTESAPVELAPLEPASDPDEAAVRLIALDAAMSGRPRGEVEAELKVSHPAVDAKPLLERFYSQSAPEGSSKRPSA